MSIDHCNIEINHFLETAEPEVLVIAGKWGVGKTFAWKHYLGLASKDKKIVLKKYAYVSLFGLSNLNEIKDAIFQNTVSSEAANNTPNFSTFESGLATIRTSWRKGGWLAALLPQTDSYASFIAKMGYFSLKVQVVCIDDLERRGASLDIRDVLGLISQLKEEKKCKVVLLLNDKKLGEDEAEFRIQLEKVADTLIRFEPTSEEAATIGLDSSLPIHEYLSADCIALKIVNIRTIKKLERLAIRLHGELVGFDSRVLKQAIHSVSLFGFSKFHPDVAPTIEYLRSLNSWDEIFKEDEKDTTKAEWRSLISEYGFGQIDEFDQVILDGFEAGHFNSDRLHTTANQLGRQLQAQDADNSFSEAWGLYSGSFENNANEVMEKFVHSLAQTPTAVTPHNLSGAIELLKELQWRGNIGELIASYIKGRDDGKDFLDLSKDRSGGDIKSPDVRKAFNEKLATFPELRDFSEILIKMGEKNGYSPSDFPFLASHDKSVLYELFMRLKGADLRRAIKGALWLKDSTEYPEMQTLGRAAEEALREIASQSDINRRRVKMYGISIDDDQKN
jgi:hypothetical protein